MGANVPSTGGAGARLSRRGPLAGCLLGSLFAAGGAFGQLLPVPWQHADVGAVVIAGAASYAAGVFTVDGDGADIGGTADAFHYVYQNITGDCEIIARVASQDGGNIWAKAGVMIRDNPFGSHYAGAKHVCVALSPRFGGRARGYYRDVQDGDTTIAGWVATAAPHWFRLVRMGDVITAYESPDGSSWAQVAQVTVTMTDPVYVGLCVTSEDEGLLYNATFDNVTAREMNDPTVASTVPADGDYDVALSAAIAVTFSEEMDQATAEAAVSVLDGGGAGVAGTAQLIGDTLTFTPAAALDNERYTVTIAGAAEDPAGNLLDGNGDGTGGDPYAFSFWTVLPAPWEHSDVGTVGPAGGAGYSQGSFTVEGDGAEIFGTADAFHYVHRSITGDCEIIARVTSVENTGAFPVGGVMIREDTDSLQHEDAAHVLVGVYADGNTRMLDRDSTGAATNLAATDPNGAPYWVRLVRAGDVFTGYGSPDGSTWSLVALQPVSMTGNVFVGLAVNSYNGAQLCTATFENVALTVRPGIFDLLDPSDGALDVPIEPTLDWEDSSNAQTYTLLLDDDPGFGSPLVDDDSLTESTYTVGAGVLQPDTQYHWRVIAFNTDGSNGASNNYFSFTTAATPPEKPDLVVDSIVPTDAGPDVGDTISVDVTVSNATAIDATESFVVALFCDRAAPPNVGDTPDATRQVSGLSGTSQTSVTFTNVTSAAPGSWDTYAIVDNGDAVVEEDEANNVSGPVAVQWSVAGVELVITALSPSDAFPPVGGTIDVEVTVLNLGDTDAGGFSVDLFHDEVAAPAVGDAGDDWQTVSSLAAGAETTLTFAGITWPSAGPWQMYAVVDSDDDVAEADETNNVAGPTEVLWLSGGVDLVVTAVTPSDATPPVGGSITVQVTVLNQGAAAAGAFSIELFLDEAVAPSVGDSGDATEPVASLAGGSYVTVGFPGVTGPALATWETYAIVDNGEAVGEDEEANNVSGPVTVEWVVPASEEPYLGTGCGAGGVIAWSVLVALSLALGSPRGRRRTRSR